LEKAIAQVWKDVLRLPRVGVHDNFFELGGHSLLATQVISRLNNQFHLDIPMRSLFSNPTVLKMSEYIKTLQMVVLDMQLIPNDTPRDYEEEEL
jgi:acyl carrier protein